MRCVRTAARCVVVIALISLFGPQVVLATGPTEQTLPWVERAQFQNSWQNSVVEMQLPIKPIGGVDNNQFVRGTGVIVGRKVAGGVTGDGWWAVLTADHNLTVPAGFERTGNMKIVFADPGDENLNINGVAQFPGGKRVFGGTEMVEFRKGPTGTEDMAVVGIKYGAVDLSSQPYNPATQFFVDIKQLSMRAGTAQGHVDAHTQFSEIGYGDRGSFARDVGTGATGITQVASDDKKRFQNNRIETTFNINDGIYNYTGMRWNFDIAPAFQQGADNFLTAEGMSFGGDSGAPYLVDRPYVRMNVPAMTRPGGNDWALGNMDVDTDFIIGLHTNGFRTASGSVFPYFGQTIGTTTYDTGGLGIPLTQDRIDWVVNAIVNVPEPGTTALAFCALIFQFSRGRRRRR